MAYDPTKVNLGADMPTAPTASDRDPWQEALTRFRTVPASKVLEAADVIRDLNGSWAAHYVLEPGLRNAEGQMSEDGREPANRVVKSSRLGQPGVPEINFDLYAHRTNRFAHKGGSLLGHPISFSVVGPTIKRDGLKFTNWQWAVTDNSSFPGIGDTLTLDTEILDPVGFLPIPRTFGLTQRYGLAGMIDVPDGLYVIIIQTGQTGEIVNPADPTGPPVAGSTGDGFVYQGLGPPLRVPLVALTPSSKYEIFRVVGMDTVVGPEPDTLILDHTKRLASYFSFTPGEQNTVRAIMLIEPKATRLLAVPDSGTKGAEQVHIVVPPHRAAQTDQHYPFSSDPAQITQPQGWIGDDFIEPRFQGIGANGNVDPYSAFEYKEGPNLPIPRSRSGTGVVRLNGEWTAPAVHEPLVDFGPGRFPVIHEPHFPSAGISSGQVIHVHEIKVRGNPVLNPTTTSPTRRMRFDSMLGWFEVVRILADNSFLLRRVAESDPVDGHAYFGNSLLFQLANSVGQGDRVELHYTAHDPIEVLWNTPHFDIDRVESARLTNLINPDWVERLIKEEPITPARADRAIFDTTSSNAGLPGSNANPGSLLDLGFRVVLYPATVREVTVPWPDDTIGWDPFALTWGRTRTFTSVVPDFNRPVMANEALLENTSSGRAQKQFVEVDYSNGMVRLSHTPTVGSDLYPTTNAVFTADDNPRGELVIFASCVPYSMEEGQLGSAIRATASPPTDTPCEEGWDPPNEIESLDQQDVFGERVYAPLRDQTLTSDPGGGVPAILVYGLLADQIPETGFVDILQIPADLHPPFNQISRYPMGTPVFTDENSRGATFGYYGVVEDPTGAIFGAGSNTTGLMYPFGGGVHGSTLPVDLTDDPAVAVLRRDVTTPNTIEAITGTPYQYDTVYGDSWRSKTLRFENASVKANADGTTTIRMESYVANQVQETLGDLFSNWVLAGCELSFVDNSPTSMDVFCGDGVILADGHRLSIPKQFISLTADGRYYIYLDRVGCFQLEDYASLPLPGPGDILLGMAELSGFPGAPVLTLTDLRYPLDDVDRRWDVTVGKLGDGEAKWATYAPHFDKMADAIKYVNNVMRPKTGTADRHLRIRVVGPTDEAAADLPIKIETDGIIIEGANRFIESYALGVGDPVELRWDADTAFFDLNSRAGLVFRNLTFKWTGGSPGTLATPIRSVFTQGDEPPAFNIVIDHCAAYGYVQGLLKVTSDHQIHHLTVTRCFTERALDFGIYSPGGINQSLNWTIRDNLFSQYNAGGTMTNVAAITVNGRSDHIENNLTARFEKGILVWGNLGPAVESNTRVVANYVRDTLEEGIVVEDGQGVQVLGNALAGIHSATPAVSKTGIWVKDGPKHKVGDNFVQLVTPSTGDKAIWVQGTGIGNIVSDNDCVIDALGVVQVDTEEAQVKGNKCKEMNLGAGSIRVETNKVDIVCRLAGNGCLVSGNQIVSLEAGYDVTTDTLNFSNGHVISNNVVSNLYLGENCSVTGNDLGTVYVDEECRVVGNDVGWLKEYVDGPSPATHSTHVAPEVVIANNQIAKVGEDGAGAEDGILEGLTDVIFEGNHVTASLAIREEAGTNVQNVRIASNKIIGNFGVGTAAQPINFANVIGNYVQTGGNSMAQYGDYCTVSGNEFSTSGGAFTIQGNQNRIGHNFLQGTLNVGGDYCLVSENNVTGTGSDLVIQAGGDTCTVTGNRVEENITISAPNCTVTGNVAGIDLTVSNTGQDTTVSGNRVGTDININDTGCTVNGNRVNGDIIINDAVGDAVIVGNSCDEIVMSGGGGGGNNIAVANRVYGNNVFGAVGGGPVVDNNFQ